MTSVLPSPETAIEGSRPPTDSGSVATVSEPGWPMPTRTAFAAGSTKET
jgi:hypothetical protein